MFRIQILGLNESKSVFIRRIRVHPRDHYSYVGGNQCHILPIRVPSLYIRKKYTPNKKQNLDLPKNKINLSLS